MTLKKMIEMVQKHHSKLTPSEIKEMLSRASVEVAVEAGFYREYVEKVPVDGQTYYTLPTNVSGVNRVDVDGVRISRTIPIPSTGLDPLWYRPVGGL